MPIDNAILLVLLALLAGGWWWWWTRVRDGNPEADLRHICFGDQAQVDRLIDGELRRAGGQLSRAEAARRAVDRYRRDNR